MRTRPSPKFSSVRRLSLPRSWASFSPKLTRSLLARLSCVAKLAGERTAGRVPAPPGKRKSSGAEAGLGGAAARGALSVRFGVKVMAASGDASCAVASVASVVRVRDTTRAG